MQEEAGHDGSTFIARKGGEQFHASHPFVDLLSHTHELKPQNPTATELE